MVGTVIAPSPPRRSAWPTLSNDCIAQISGVELCRILKNRYATAHVPVVLCSSLSTEELAGLARKCEADGHLSKIEEGIERFPEEVLALCKSLAW